MDFDYKRAWKKIVSPQVQCLEKEAFSLYELTVKKAADLCQASSLAMPWPNDGFRQKFRELPTELLARSSRLLYFWGHWSSEGHSKIGNGATWKFSMYADQTLQYRFGLPIEVDRGLGLELHQGVLRLTRSSRDEWTWDRLEMPIDNNVQKAKAALTAENYARPFQVVLSELRANLQTGWFTKFDREVSKCYVPEGDIDKGVLR
jgi:hypothetical protein